MNIHFFRQISILIFLVLAICCKGQITNQCIDENRINPFYQCSQPFYPVCGCDGTTYANECLSYNAGGNNTIIQTGVCPNELFYFAVWPTFVEDQFRFLMQFAPQQESAVSLLIFNSFGNTVLSRNLTNVRSDFKYEESIYVYDLEPGVYFVTVQSRGVRKVTRFVKHDY